MKTCSKCGESKDDNAFNTRDKNKNILRKECKKCASRLHKDHYIKNSEKIKKRVSYYKQQNPEKIKERVKKYYEKNKEELYAISRKYKEEHKKETREYLISYKKKNREKILEHKRNFYQRHKEEILKSNAAYRNERIKQDVSLKLRTYQRARIWRVLRTNNCISKKLTMELVGCTKDELKSYLESLFITGMTWDNYGKWHIDHIIPCAAFDLSDPEQQKECFHYTNMQPLWARDNLMKSDKMPDGSQARNKNNH